MNVLCLVSQEKMNPLCMVFQEWVNKEREVRMRGILVWGAERAKYSNE